jgi:hypothetical protein
MKDNRLFDAVACLYDMANQAASEGDIHKVHYLVNEARKLEGVIRRLKMGD